MNMFRAILENIAEFQPELSKDIAEAGFMAWLVKKLKVLFQLVIVANKFETAVDSTLADCLQQMVYGDK